MYEEKSKNFIRIFALLLGLSIFFLFMIFLPYVFILKNFHQTNTDLNEVQSVHGDLGALQNGTNNLQSDLQDDTGRIKLFLTKIIGDYINYREGCVNGNAELLKRSIQTTNKEIMAVKENIKDNNLWSLDVCNKLDITEPPEFATVLYFYQSNIPDSTKTYKPYATFGPKKDQDLPAALTKTAISQLEYYNSSFHIGSPFWLNYSAQNKINSIFSGHNNYLIDLNRQITDLNQSLSSIKTDVINKTSLFKTLNDLIIDATAFKDDLKYLHLKYLEIVPAATKNLNLTTLSEIPINDTFDVKLIPQIQRIIQASTNPAFMNITTTLNGQIGEFENTIRSLNDRLNELQNKKDDTSNRLKEIEFPFGSIPIDINESILFFPIGISAGFWISASLLGDALKLRKRYHTQLRDTQLGADKTKSNKGKEKNDTNKQGEETDKENKKKINEHLSLLYPIWIDPTTPLSIRIVKSVILSVPVLIFAASIYFLSDSWNIIISQQEEGLFVGNSGEYVILYIASYVISAIFFFCGYWKIVNELRRYHKG